MEHMEIERKWLMDGFPPLQERRRALVEQGYLTFSPNTVRIRRVVEAGTSRYFLTIKGKGTLVRPEVEMSVSAAEYEALLPLLAAPPAIKDYRVYDLPGGLLLECNLVDEGQPAAFYYAEVEFESEAAAAAFRPPAYLGREVTQEPGYSMAAYCRGKARMARGQEGSQENGLE